MVCKKMQMPMWHLRSVTALAGSYYYAVGGEIGHILQLFIMRLVTEYALTITTNRDYCQTNY